MCAILGGTDRQWDYHNALYSMIHRGPDSQRIVEFESLTMGFDRLSIVDLSNNGMQPMVNCHGLAITFNGEIYGFKRIRDELKGLGYVFKSETDTEVILNAYLEWGEDFINDLDGMFAIAIYDSKKNKLVLYRDRAGIKPLYYYFDGKYFAYASELKALKILLKDTNLKLDYTALFDYHHYFYIPEPKTMYKNISTLEPGSKLVFDFEKSSIVCNERYWQLHVNSDMGEKPASEEQILRVRGLIEQSVNDQLVADVPVGGFLSGGIDSSILTVEAKRLDNNYVLHSIGFYDYDTNEIPYVRCLEDRYGFQSKKYYLKQSEFEELYNELPEWYDEPFADTSAFPSYVVSRESKKDCTVMLAGDGGDEVFGGYARYKLFYNYSKEGEKTTEEDFDYIKEIYGWRKKDSILRSEFGIDKDYDSLWYFRKYYIKELPPITRLQYMDYHTYMPGDILQKMDRVSMACSLEVRVPFLARDIVEFAFSCTEQERCYNGELKSLLKRAYENDIPRNVLYRRKAGFAIPTSFFGFGKLPQDVIYDDIYKLDKYLTKRHEK